MLLTGQLPVIEAEHVVSEKIPEVMHDVFQPSGSEGTGGPDAVPVPSTLLQTQGKSL